jgi:hypothetical protein
MYRALGETYTIGTSLPLMPQVQLDVPVGQIAMDTIRSQALVILGIAVVAAFAGSVAANLTVPGRR